MKIRKGSVTVIAAAFFIIILTGVFAVSAKRDGNRETSGKEIQDLTEKSGFSREEYEKLLVLKLEGYEDMTVREYREKIRKLTDTEEYRDLLERFSHDEASYAMRDTDETAAFFFYILEPLTAEEWQSGDFSGYVLAGFPERPDKATLEYNITLSIEGNGEVTVREYNNARLGMMNGLRNCLTGKSMEELKDEAAMAEALPSDIDEMIENWENENLRILVKYSFMPLEDYRYEYISDGLMSGEYYWLPLEEDTGEKF